MSTPLAHHRVVTRLSQPDLLNLLRDVAGQAADARFVYYAHPQSEAAFSMALQSAPSQVVGVLLFRIDGGSAENTMTPEIVWQADAAPGSPHADIPAAAEHLASQVCATVRKFDAGAHSGGDVGGASTTPVPIIVTPPAPAAAAPAPPAPVAPAAPPAPPAPATPAAAPPPPAPPATSPPPAPAAPAPAPVAAAPESPAPPAPPAPPAAAPPAPPAPPAPLAATPPAPPEPPVPPTPIAAPPAPSVSVAPPAPPVPPAPPAAPVAAPPAPPAPPAPAATAEPVQGESDPLPDEDSTTLDAPSEPQASAPLKMPPPPPAPPVAAASAMSAGQATSDPVMPALADEPVEAVALPEAEEAANAATSAVADADADADADNGSETGDAAEPLEDDDFDLTIVSARRAPRVIWSLTDEAGRRVELDSLAIIGRKPTRPAEFDVAQLVPLADPGRMMSKTHALIETDEDSAWITDLGSTNGTELLQNGQGVGCAPHERTPVSSGARLQFGGLEVRLNREES